MIKLLKSLLCSLSTMIVLLAGLVLFITWTEPGLQLLGRLGISSLGNGSSIESIHGRLGQSIEIHGLKLVLGEDRYDIAELQLDWSPRQLLSGRLRIDRLSADQVVIKINSSTQDSQDQEDFSVPDLRLPIGLQLVEASIGNVQIEGLGEQPLQAERISLSAHSDAERLHIEALHLVTPQIDATLAGQLGLHAQADSDLKLQWKFASDSADALATTGQLAAQGTLQNYRMDAQAGVGSNSIPFGDWKLSGTGDLHQLSIGQLNGQTLDGTVSGSATLTWSPAVYWDANLALDRINPGEHWSDWQGQLAAQLKTSGDGSGEKMQLSIMVGELKGRLRGYKLAGQADIAMTGEHLAIQRLRITSGENTFTASGTLTDRWKLNTQIIAPDLAALVPDWSGALDASAAISGSAAQPQIDARLDGKQLYGPSLSMQTLNGDLKLAVADKANQSVDLQIGKLQLGNQYFEQATLNFSGPWQRHRLTLAAEGEGQLVDLQLSGGWNGQLWQGNLNRADWQMPSIGLWTLPRPVSMKLGPQLVEVPDTCLVQEQSKLCIHASGNPQKTLKPGARLERLPLAVLEEMFDTPLQISNLVDASLTASLKGGRLDSAGLEIELGAGGISYDDPDLPTESHLEKGHLRSTLDKEGLSANLDLDVAGSDYLNAELRLPGYRPQTTDWHDQSLALKINGDLKDLLIIKYLLDDIGSFEGTMNVALQGTGTLGNPLLAGGATLSDATLAIDSLGIQLERLNLKLQSSNDGLSLNGSAVSGKGQIDLLGNLAFNDIANWEANVSLKGTRFEAMHQPEALILISPDLQATIAPPEIHLNGELHIPSARLKPKDLGKQTGRSSDVIVMDSKTAAPPEERWQVYTQARLSLGNDVEINGLGLKGDLLGAVELRDKPKQVSRAQGRLSIERGSYEAYGRKLDIERGQLLFSGGPVDNPGLDFRASRTIRDVTAGIRVSGTLIKPELTLFSDPAMSESDIISYISFGRPMSQVGEGSGSAADSGLIAGGNLLGGMVGSAVGLEELGVEGGDSADDAAMVLGTYLSPQLYVRYRTSLYEAVNEFHVLYDFTRSWGIRTISSAEKSSAEVRFSFER